MCDSCRVNLLTLFGAMGREKSPILFFKNKVLLLVFKLFCSVVLYFTS